MAIQIISDNHLTTIKKLFEDTQNSISIISPFIGSKMADILCENKEKNENISITIITRWYRDDFLTGVSDVYALEKLCKKNIDIFALKGLHTKLYLFDENKAIVGSANFTLGGFCYNHELSLLINDEKELNQGLKSFFLECLQKIKSQGNFLITQEKFNNEIELINNLLESRKGQYKTFSNPYQFGAEIEKTNKNHVEGSKNSDIVQDILKSEKKPFASLHTNVTKNANIWLKFEGENDDRQLITTKYLPTVLKGQTKAITCFPGGKTPSVKDNDFAYVAVVSKDEKGNNVSPYIVGRGVLTSTYTATQEMIDEMKWMEKYSICSNWVTFEYLDTEIKNTIPLLKILTEVGSNTYPSTQGKKVDLQELRTRHYQKSHMHLTEEARNHIDWLFDNLEEKYGSIKI